MEELRIAVLEYYPDVATALKSTGNGDQEVFYHLAINEAGDGCSVFFRDDVFDKVSPYLAGGKETDSLFPRFDFQEAKSHDIIDQLRKAFVLQVHFLKAGEIEYLLD